MDTPKFGSLTPVDLRECWPHEAGDFTPWLAQKDNIQLLGVALGMELELQQQEASVGDFSADLFCIDAADEEPVVIENQLERTNHRHLGQILTYAAGLEACTVVWVVKEFREEHRAALDWLNRITESKFRFFGLEIEAFRIGDSPPAPRFEVVVKPNDWAKSISSSSIELSNDRESYRIRSAFWETLGERIAITGRKLRKPSLRGNRQKNYGLGCSNSYVSPTLSTQTDEIYIQIRLVRKLARVLFDGLESHKEEIEAEVGGPLNWVGSPERKSCCIIYRADWKLSEKEQWPAAADWLLEQMDRLGDIFRPRVESLKKQALEPDDEFEMEEGTEE